MNQLSFRVLLLSIFLAPNAPGGTNCGENCFHRRNGAGGYLFSPCSRSCNELFISDRPEFTESIRVVPCGQSVVEAGYFVVDDSLQFGIATIETVAQSTPLAVRIGVNDWLELRFRSGYTDRDQTLRAIQGGIPITARARTGGVDDVLVGFKAAVWEQDGIRPELTALAEVTVPTGSDVSSDAMYPVLGAIYQWQLNDRTALKGSTQGTGIRGVANEDIVAVFQSAVLEVDVGQKGQGFAEWAALFSDNTGASPSQNAHDLNFGFRYAATQNLQFDIHGGFGLSEDANDRFLGGGIVYRR